LSQGYHSAYLQHEMVRVLLQQNMHSRVCLLRRRLCFATAIIIWRRLSIGALRHVQPVEALAYLQLVRNSGAGLIDAWYIQFSLEQIAALGAEGAIFSTEIYTLPM